MPTPLERRSRSDAIDDRQDSPVTGPEPGAAITSAAAFVRRHAFTLAALATVLLAALLRFWRLDLAEFKGDELAVTRLAFALAQQGRWPDRGIVSSLGTYNSALFVYVEALPALLWASPLALTALVAALNVLAVALAIGLARRYFGSVTALVSGLLFASTPWAVVFSRKIWEQDLLPPVVLIFFLALFAVVIDRKPRGMLVCGVAAAVAIQLHPSAVVLPVVALFALLLWPERFPWRYVAAACALAIVVLLLYVWAEWWHGFADWQFALQGGTNSGLGPLLGLVVALINWLEAASGWQVLGQFTPTGLSHNDPIYVTLADISTWVMLALAAVYLLAQCRRLLATGAHRNDRTAQALLLLTFWLLVPPLLLGISSLLTYPHYFIVSYPAPFLAIGVFAAMLINQGRGRRDAVLTVIALVAMLNTATVARYLLSVDRSTFPNVYGLPLAFDNQIAAAIAQDAAGRPFRVSVDPAFRDGQQVIDQMVAWSQADGSARHGSDAAATLVYWVTPLPTVPQTDARRILSMGAPGGKPLLTVWESTHAG